MKILVTGSRGFVGKNLVENLKNIRDGKDRSRPGLAITDIFEYDVDAESSVLEKACAEADFVFHLAGVNRPENPADYFIAIIQYNRHTVICLVLLRFKNMEWIAIYHSVNYIGKNNISNL